MRFSLAEQLALPCFFEQLVPGRMHPDGRRYLPTIILRLAAPAGSGISRISVVDRHHVVDPADEGREGVARLVFLLSQVRLQEPPPRQGLFDQAAPAGRPSAMPEAYGRVLAVPTWEAGGGQLPFETLYTELLLDVGAGVVGVRTSATAASLAEQIGAEQIAPGDWIAVARSRVDILGFTAAA